MVFGDMPIQRSFNVRLIAAVDNMELLEVREDS